MFLHTKNNFFYGSGKGKLEPVLKSRTIQAFPAYILYFKIYKKKVYIYVELSYSYAIMFSCNLNCVEYLMDENNLIETRNKVVKLRQLDLTKVKEKKGIIQLNALVSPVLILSLFGLLYTFIRRRKFA